jgi:drug/metabolite transporter (DMT)-like permease
MNADPHLGKNTRFGGREPAGTPREGTIMSGSLGRQGPMPFDWFLLLALTVMWGSAFALTKVAVAQLPPAFIVTGRLTIGAGLLLLWWWASRRCWPRQPRLWLFFALIAAFGSVIPFHLIAWGQQFIDSGLAGILMAVMPLFTLMLAHLTLPDERMTPVRLAGFGVGLGGVALLLGPDIDLHAPGTDRFLPATLAVLGGALCYAVAAILSRLRPPSDAVTSAAATATLAALAAVSTTPPDLAAIGPTTIPAGPALAVLLLGMFSTGLATVVYFKLIARTGPKFVSPLNDLIPLWAVLLGGLFFGERLTSTDYLAIAVILGGIALSQRSGRTTPVPATAPARHRSGG